MAQNPNDIQLRIQAAVDGLQDIGKLLGELDDLGADTTEASADVEQLNEAMSTLGQQRKLIDSLEQTRQKVDAAEDSMNEAVAEAKRLKAAYDDSAEGVSAQRRAAEQAAATADQASEAYQKQRRDLQALQTQYKGVQAETVGARQAWRDAAQRVRDLETAIEASGAATGEQARQLEQARGAADEARRSYQRQADSLSGVRDQLQQQRQSVDKARTAWEGYREQSRDLNRDLKESERAFTRQGKELDRAEKAADKARTSFERQGQSLDELSQDARRAGVDVDNLADEQQRLDRESRELEGSVDQLKGRLREYRQQVDGTEGSVRKLSRSLAGGIKRFAAWGAAAAAGGAALSVGLLARYTAAQAKMADQLDNTSESLDTNAQRLQEIQYALDRTGDGASDAAELLKDVADKIGDAYENGGGEAKDAIDALGLSLDELIELAPDEMLLRLASAMQSLPKASQVNILESLSNDASLLGPLLADNAAQLRELAAEARNVGAIQSDADLERLRETNRAVERLQGRFQGLRNRLLGELAPAVTDVADEFDQLLEENPGLVDDLATAFGGLLRKTSDWMQYIITNRERVGGALQSLIDTAQFLGNTFEAVFRGIQTVIAGILSGVAQAYSHVRNLMERVTEALNDLGLASDETLAKMRGHAEAARAAVRDLEAQTVAYGKQALQAGKDAISAYDNTAQAAEDSAARQARANAQVDQQALNTAHLIGEQALAHEDAARGAEEGARRQQRAIESAAETLGTTVEELQTGISEGNQEAIAAFDTLARSGELSAKQLRDALASVWSGLESKEEREAFAAAIQQMVTDGVEGAGTIAGAWRQMRADFEADNAAIAESSRQVGQAAKDAADQAKESQDKAAASAGSFGDALVNNMQRVANAVALSNTAMAKLPEFLRSGMQGTRDTVASLRDQLEEVSTKAKQAASSFSFVPGLTRWWRDNAMAVFDVQRAYLAQRLEVEKLTKSLQNGQTAGADLTWTMDDLRDRFDSLDEADLSTLEGEISRIRGEVESLRDSLADTVAAAQQELAGLDGDRKRVEELQYAEERAELEAQLARAKALDDQQAQQRAREALRLSDQIHERKLEQIREEAEAEKKAALHRERQQAEQRQRDEVNQREQSAQQQRQTDRVTNAIAAARPTRRVQIDLKAESGNATLYADDDREAERAIRALQSAAQRSS